MALNGNGKIAPSAPQSVKKVNGTVEREWRVKRVIPEEVPDQNGEVKSERERAMEREMRQMRQQIAKLQSQIDRLGRIDGPGARARDHQLLQATLQSTLALVTEIQQIIHPSPDFEGMQIDGQLLALELAERDRRREETTEIAISVVQIDRLMRARKTYTAKCPCGQHKGICFSDGDTVLEENMCPVDWWHKQSHHAFYQGKLGTFMQETPLKKYLKLFEL